MKILLFVKTFLYFLFEYMLAIDFVVFYSISWDLKLVYLIKIILNVKLNFNFIFIRWWAWLELNQRPIGYEPTALTPELQARSLEVKMAEGMRFELTVPVMVHSLSRGALSATQAPFQKNYKLEYISLLTFFTSLFLMAER